MKVDTAIGYFLAIFIVSAVGAIAEENRFDQYFQQPPGRSPSAEALKNLTGKTPEEYAASEASHRCYDVVMPPRGGQSSVITPVNSILLNRCTGETWLLVRTPTGKQQGYTFRWFPLTSVTGEVVFSE